MKINLQRYASITRRIKNFEDLTTELVLKINPWIIETIYGDLVSILVKEKQDNEKEKWKYLNVPLEDILFVNLCLFIYIILLHCKIYFE